MSRTTVVGYDESDAARAALTAAARRVGAEGHLVVAHVVQVPSVFIGTPYYEGNLERARERADQVLKGLDDVVPPGTRLETSMTDGPPARELAEMARSVDADEIAVGSRGFGAFRAGILGSTSHALLHETDRPLLIMTRRAAEREQRQAASGAGLEEPRAVVVGYDGSDCARAALQYAASRARDTGGPLVAVYAFDAPADWLGSPYYQLSLDEHQRRGKEVLSELEEQFGGEPSFETDLVNGPPAEALVRAAQARAATEIVVGSRGFGRFRGAIGSVSHALLHEADCPVVIVPMGLTTRGAD